MRRADVAVERWCELNPEFVISGGADGDCASADQTDDVQLRATATVDDQLSIGSDVPSNLHLRVESTATKMKVSTQGQSVPCLTVLGTPLRDVSLSGPGRFGALHITGPAVERVSFTDGLIVECVNVSELLSVVLSASNDVRVGDLLLGDAPRNPISGALTVGTLSWSSGGLLLGDYVLTCRRLGMEQVELERGSLVVEELRNHQVTLGTGAQLRVQRLATQSSVELAGGAFLLAGDAMTAPDDVIAESLTFSGSRGKILIGPGHLVTPRFDIASSVRVIVDSGGMVTFPSGQPFALELLEQAVVIGGAEGIPTDGVVLSRLTVKPGATALEYLNFFALDPAYVPALGNVQR